MRADGMALRSRMAAYSPAGPPPRHTIRFMPRVPSQARIAMAADVLYSEILQVSIISPGTRHMSTPSRARTAAAAQTLTKLMGAILKGGIRVVDLTAPLEAVTPTIPLPPQFRPS